MIVISHNLNDVFAVADRVAVLRLGRMVSVGPMSQYDAESLVDLMTTGTSKRLAASRPRPPQGAPVSTEVEPTARPPRPPSRDGRRRGRRPRGHRRLVRRVR